MIKKVNFFHYKPDTVQFSLAYLDLRYNLSTLFYLLESSILNSSLGRTIRFKARRIRQAWRKINVI